MPCFNANSIEGDRAIRRRHGGKAYAAKNQKMKSHAAAPALKGGKNRGGWGEAADKAPLQKGVRGTTLLPANKPRGKKAKKHSPIGGTSKKNSGRIRKNGQFRRRSEQLKRRKDARSLF